MSYSDFAAVYDQLNVNADVPARFAYVTRLLERHGHTPALLLDAACGTGSFSVLFARRGVEVIGADLSEEMLCMAQQKAMQNNVAVFLTHQALSELTLPRKADTVICMMDGLNHIIDEQELLCALERISICMEPGGVFLFDVNTVYKHREILGDHSFVIETEDVLCVWQNEQLEEEIVRMDLDFFIRLREKNPAPRGDSTKDSQRSREEGVIQQQDLYERKSETFSERAYPAKTLEALLMKAGFEVQGTYDDMTFSPPHPRSERVFYVAGKV